MTTTDQFSQILSLLDSFFVNSSYTEFYENPKSDSSADTSSQKYRQCIHIRHLLFYFVMNA